VSKVSNVITFDDDLSGSIGGP